MADEQWTLMRRVAQEALDDAEEGGTPPLSERDRKDLLDTVADHFCAAFALDNGKLRPRYFYRRQLRRDRTK